MFSSVIHITPNIISEFQNIMVNYTFCGTALMTQLHAVFPYKSLVVLSLIARVTLQFILLALKVTLHDAGIHVHHGRCACVILLSFAVSHAYLYTILPLSGTDISGVRWAAHTTASIACFQLLSCMQCYLSNHRAHEELDALSAPSRCPLKALSQPRTFPDT